MHDFLEPMEKSIPPPKRSYIKTSEDRELTVLAAIMSAQKLHCVCGSTTQSEQYLMYRFRRGTNGKPFLQTGKASLMERFPNIPREIYYNVRHVEACFECFHPTETTVSTKW